MPLNTMYVHIITCLNRGGNGLSGKNSKEEKDRLSQYLEPLKTFSYFEAAAKKRRSESTKGG